MTAAEATDRTADGKAGAGAGRRKSLTARGKTARGKTQEKTVGR